jgi:hypothetical protein
VSKFRIWNRIAAALLVLVVASAANAQTMSKSDETLLKAKLAAAHKAHFDTLPIADRIVAFGKTFLGTPYVAGTLDTIPKTEKLIENLHGLDCVTFYETSLALARTTSYQPADFYKQLTLLRYRNGKIAGYPSRLHYTTDYFYNAEQKGLLKNVMKDVGPFFTAHDDRQINFMSEHRSSYKQLADDRNFEAIKKVESDMASRGGFDYIPKNKIFLMEPKIKSGDILGITTDIQGLDVSHTGIAVRESGHIHFMHASSAQHKVIISDEPLADYLKNNAHQTGIIIMRPVEVNNGEHKAHILPLKK